MISLIDNRILVQLPAESEEGICGVCGEQEPVFDILKKTFTNIDELKSNMICAKCACLFSGEWLKTAFCFTAKELKKLKQGEFEGLLFSEGLDFPCILSFSESRKKHRLFRSKVSVDRQQVYISTDNGMVILDLTKDRGLFEALSELYNMGISKSMIRDGVYSSGLLYKIEANLGKFWAAEKAVKKHRNTLKFNLLLDFVNKK